jgi:hypothetical protein
LEDKVEAQKKYQESLPFENIAQILEEDAAAHQKYRESLPPKKKAQILENDAAAHKNTGSPSLLRRKPKSWRIMLQHTKNIINII